MDFFVPDVFHLGDVYHGGSKSEFDVFTPALLQVWDDGRFQGGHREFIAAIAALVDRDLQQPNLTFLAPLDETFATMRPFTW